MSDSQAADAASSQIGWRFDNRYANSRSDSSLEYGRYLSKLLRLYCSIMA